MQDITIKLSRADDAILRAIAGLVHMDPNQFLRFAGESLLDALTGLRTAMSKSADIREQVTELVTLRESRAITDQQFAAMLVEVAELAEPGSDQWSDDASD